MNVTSKLTRAIVNNAHDTVFNMMSGKIQLGASGVAIALIVLIAMYLAQSIIKRIITLVSTILVGVTVWIILLPHAMYITETIQDFIYPNITNNK